MSRNSGVCAFPGQGDAIEGRWSTAVTTNVMSNDKLEMIDPIEFPDWDDLLLSTPGHSFFHTSFWARVLRESYGYLPCYLTQIRDGKLTVLVPLMEVRSRLTGRRGVSLPFTDYCDVIIADANDWPEVLQRLIHYGEDAQWRYLKLRGGEDFLDGVCASSSYYRHVVELLEDVDDVYSHIKSSTRRNIRKAVRDGVTISRYNTLNSVREFYRIHCLTRKKHGLPPQPYHFFEKIYEHVIGTDHGQVVLATHQGKTIAGALFLHFGGEAIYKFGASDTAHLYLRPNDLVMWEAIKWYCRNGYRRFCFGRTDMDQEGLRQFKKGWGARERTIRYFKYDVGRKEFKGKGGIKGSFLTRIFRRVPVPVSRWIGKAMYRHVG